MSNVRLARIGDPERDPYPSVDDPNDAEQLCEFCEARPTERHHPMCANYQPTFDDLAWCDRCGTEYATKCACDGHDCEDK